ncbi:MAG: hypothetical protein ACT4UP_06040 [Gammaproteobacteria bacterium]
MATTIIRIGVKEEPKQTTTVFKVGKNDHVEIQNAGPATLTLTFANENSPLCKQGQQGTVNPIVLDAGKGEKYKVCKGEIGDSFSYVAQINGYEAEDPIVIIEASAPSPIFMLLRDPIVIIETTLIVVALLALGYWFGKRAAAKKAQASAGRP